MSADQKTNRLQALAKRAGDLMVEAYLGGNRERAVFFQQTNEAHFMADLRRCAQGKKIPALTVR